MSKRVILQVLAGSLAAGLSFPVAADPPTQKAPAGVTLRGQVVCSDCWGEADRRKKAYGTPADLECARFCEKASIPAALAVDEKGTSCLYRLEDGAFKREGKGWLRYIAKRVEIVGTVREEKGTPWLRVDALRLIAGKEK